MDKYIKDKLDSFGFSLTQQMLLVDVIKHVAQQISNSGGIDTSNLVTKEEFTKKTNEMSNNIGNSFNNFANEFNNKLNNKANSSDIPTKISELQRDDIYIVENLNDLTIDSNIETIIDALGTYEDFISAINNKKIILYNNNIINVVVLPDHISIFYLKDSGLANRSYDISIVNNNYDKISRTSDIAVYVMNNLTSNSATAPISAAQGKLLNDKITELAAKVEEYHPAS